MLQRSRQPTIASDRWRVATRRWSRRQKDFVQEYENLKTITRILSSVNRTWFINRRHWSSVSMILGKVRVLQMCPVIPLMSSLVSHRVPMHPWKYLKVLEFFSSKFKAMKVLENRTGAWKSLNFIPQVLESRRIDQVKLCDISSSVKQVFRLKQDLLINVTFCFYQLKLSRNHRNGYYMLL